MKRRKALVIGLVVVIGIAAIGFQRPIRTEWHKWRLQATKEKKLKYMSSGISGWDKFWMEVTGRSLSLQQFERTIQEHEDALVALGFLMREEYVPAAGTMPTRVDPAYNETVEQIERECHWYSARELSPTSLLVTAPSMAMEKWRKAAEQFGLKRKERC